MRRKNSKPFAEILIAVASCSVQTLEYKARTASSLAETYPENIDAFRSIESRALRQVFRILTEMPASNVDEGGFASPLSTIVYENWRIFSSDQPLDRF